MLSGKNEYALSDAKSGKLFCQDCKGDITAHLDNHHKPKK